MSKFRLYLLPFAGGNSLSFIRLTRFLDREIEVVPIEYSGRGSRREEQDILGFDSFVEDVAKQIHQREDESPYAILGYSFGSVIAFELIARRLLKKQPIHVFFCAEKSPLEKNWFADCKSSKEIDSAIIELGGMNHRILGNQILKDAYLEIIKKDLFILSQYTYAQEIVSCNASIIYGVDDLSCTNMEKWNQVINGQVRYYPMPGNHFFVQNEYEKLAEIINETLLVKK